MILSKIRFKIKLECLLSPSLTRILVLATNRLCKVRIKPVINPLTLSRQMSLSNRIHLLCKSMDWFLFERDLRHQRIEGQSCQCFHHIDARWNVSQPAVTFLYRTLHLRCLTVFWTHLWPRPSIDQQLHKI